jgi:hypothetical protein
LECEYKSNVLNCAGGNRKRTGWGQEEGKVNIMGGEGEIREGRKGVSKGK